MGRKAAPKKSVDEPKEEKAAEPDAAEGVAAAVADAVTKTEEEPTRAAGGELTAEDKVELAKYDLTAKMTPYLDRHLIFPILTFLRELGVYKQEDVTRAELKLASETCMIDLAMDKYSMIGEEAPQSLVDRREEVINEVQDLRDSVFGFLQMLEDEDKVKKIQNYQTLNEMCNELDIHHEVVDELVRYAKKQFEMGNYRLSAELLKHYRNTPQAVDQTAKYMSSLWGGLACELLQQSNSEAAAELIGKIDEALEKAQAPKRQVLLHRTWLLHWALFAIFSSEKGDSKVLDFFLNEKSLSIISLSCPHLFRYVGACLILQKRLKHLVKDTVWVIHHEAGSYSDPVTRFLLALYTEMDYDDAQRELQKCELVCKGDHFLARHWAEFQENARLHIFESYCRIHQCINIEMIATKLNMEAEEAELWIVKLIQSAKLDARIDSEKSRVVMTKAPPNVYQQVIEKTKNLAFRSTMLVSNLAKEGS